MKNLFKFKRLSFRILSRIWYIVFFVLGFICGLVINNVDVINKIKNISSQVVY